MSAVGVRLHVAVYAIQFCWGSSVCPGAALDYVPRGWVVESCMVSDAHLFVMQIHAAGRNCATFFSVPWLKKAFHGLGVQDVAEFDSD
jgi:hypothetical protein